MCKTLIKAAPVLHRCRSRARFFVASCSPSPTTVLKTWHFISPHSPGQFRVDPPAAAVAHTRNSQKQTQQKKHERKKGAIAGSVPSTANELRSTNSCDDRISASISDGLGAGSSAGEEKGGGLRPQPLAAIADANYDSSFPRLFFADCHYTFSTSLLLLRKRGGKKGGKEDKTGAAAK